MVNDFKQDLCRKVLPLMAGWHPFMQDLVLALAEAVDEPTPLAAILSTGASSSTAISRCHRAGLPSPKVIHQHLRLYAFLLLARQRRFVTTLACELGCSSSAVWGRTVRVHTGRTARAFAATDPAVFWTRFVRRVLRPTAPGWEGVGIRKTLVAA